MKLDLPIRCGECLAYSVSQWSGANDGTSGTSVNCTLLEQLGKGEKTENTFSNGLIHPLCPLRNNQMVKGR